MSRFAGVRFRGHEIKAQYASKEFPTEKLSAVEGGMLGRNRVVKKEEVERWLERRTRESRVQIYGDVLDQFTEGQAPDWTVRGERVFDRVQDRQRVMKLGTTRDSSQLDRQRFL